MVRAWCSAAGMPGAWRLLAGVQPSRPLVLRPALLASCMLVSCALLSGVASPSPAFAADVGQRHPASETPLSAATARPEQPRLAIRRTRLDNGLRVVLHRDPSLPTVAIAVAYGVGTRNEKEDEQGFARWLEHAMFQGSRNVAAGEHARQVHEQGGSHSARTSSDRTLFVDVLPAQALALGLWLEADRMKGLALSSAELSWQGRLLELELERENRELPARGARELRALVFGEAPSPASGGVSSPSPVRFSPEQQLASLRRFHQRYYAPNNAVLTLSGDFEMLEALNLIQSHFGDAKPVALPPAPGAHPAARAAPRRSQLEALDGQGPALWQGWSIPGVRTAEHDALDLAGIMLGVGLSSRLHQLLVVEKGLAQRVSAWTDGSRGPDLFGVEVQLRESTDPEQVSRLVLGQLAALGRFGPSPPELQRALRTLETNAWLQLDGNLLRASALCDAELFAHDARLLETDVERYRQVSGEDVQRAVARYLRPTRRSDVLVRTR